MLRVSIREHGVAQREGREQGGGVGGVHPGRPGGRLDEIEDDEPLVMVELLNSTAEPDGSCRTYMLRVPPTVMSAREAVAWTFDQPPERYEVAVES